MVANGNPLASVKNDFFTKNRVKTALRVGMAIYFFANEKTRVYLSRLSRLCDLATFSLNWRIKTRKTRVAQGRKE